MKVGFIGYGNFSKIRERCLRQPSCSDIEIVGFYDPNISSSTIKKFTNINDLINKIDAVIISTPPKFSPKYVQMCLSSGLNVFCEKPAAISLKDLKKIDKKLLKNNTLAYGFNHRVHPSIQKLKSLVSKNYLGKILWMRGRYGKEVDANYSSTWRCNKDLNGGGILIDQGIHMIDIMNFLVDDFDGVQALLSSNYLNIKNVEDNCFITLFSKNKKISASIHSTITQWRYLFSLEVFFEKGSIILNGLRTSSGNYGDEILTVKPNSENEHNIKFEEHVFKENVSWQTEIDSFVQACRGEKKYPYASLADAYKTTELIDKIYNEAIWL